MHPSRAIATLAASLAASLAVSLTTALAAACGGAGDSLAVTAPATGTAENVTVARAAAGLRLTNTGTAPLAFRVIERNATALIYWAPCADPGPSCVRLPAGQTVTVPFGEIGGYSSGASEVVVYTWRVVPDAGGGYRVADFGSLVVRL